MLKNDFVSLHTHSHGSLLDGFPLPSEIVARVAALDQSAVAITDHGSMATIIDFYEAANTQGVKPIAGVEAYLAADRFSKEKTDEIYHLGVLAKNNNGLNNLYHLSRMAWVEGFYKKPRIDLEGLSLYKDDLIVLSGCQNSIVGQYFLKGDIIGARFYNAQFLDIFKQNYYIEVQPWNPKELNDFLIDLADSKGIPLVVTLDSHTCLPEEKAVEEVNLLIQTSKGLKKSEKEIVSEKALLPHSSKLLDFINYLYPDRKLRFDGINNHLMGREELKGYMATQDITREDIYDNTVAIAEECSFSLEFGKNYLPKYHKRLNSFEYLKALAYEGLAEKGLTGNEVYVKQLEEELNVIKTLKFEDYFLIIWDIVNFANNNGIMTGPGRGSVAGSLLAYLLKITKVDPIKHKLLFFRFLKLDPSGKSGRIEPPDVDLDFAADRREEIKEYVINKWKNVASISTFTEFKSKGLVRDICRVFAVPLAEVNKACQFFETLDEFESSPDIKWFLERYPFILPLAKKFEGRWRAAGIHAAGVVIADRPLMEILPLETRSEDFHDNRVEVTALNMEHCAKIGLIKIDILGVSSLSIVDDCLKLIKKFRGEVINLESIPLDDLLVLEAFSQGHTAGIFQTEKNSYTQLLKKMKIDQFEDLVASNALVRPGPLLTVTQEFIERKHNKVTPETHPAIMAITDETYGLFIYQEQLMQAMVHIGNMSWQEADQIRKIIGKKRDSAEFKPFEEKWVAGAKELLGERLAKKLWHDWEKFADYAFSKNHACSYSMLSWWGMFLKLHYPLEYMCALLKNESKMGEITSYILEAKRMGVAILPPDINESKESFDIQGDQIRYGLSNIKGLGVITVKEIISKQPFDSFEDFISKVERRKCNAKAVEVLTKVGAFNSFADFEPVPMDSESFYQLTGWPEIEEEGLGIATVSCDSYNPQMVQIIRALVKEVKFNPRYTKVELEDSTGKLVLFASPGLKPQEGKIIYGLAHDKNLLNLINSDELKTKLETDSLGKFEYYLFGQIFDGEEVVYDYGVGKFFHPKVLIMPLAIRRFTTKKGRRMATIIATDGDITEKIVVFPNEYAKVGGELQEFRPLIIKPQIMDDGAITVQENGVKLLERFLKENGIST